MKELNYSDLYKKYKKLSPDQIKLLIQDIKAEMEELGERITSESFQLVNDGNHNLKYSVLIQLLEEKSSND